MAVTVSLLVLIALGVALGLWARARRGEVEPADNREHTEWLNEVARAATGLVDLPRVDVETPL